MADENRNHHSLQRRAYRWLLHRHYLLLFVALIAFVLVQPLFAILHQQAVLGVFTTLLVLASLFAVCRRRGEVILGLLLALPLFVALWADVGSASWHFKTTHQAFALAFFGYVTVQTLIHVLRQGMVTRHTLYGAACGYLLIAMTWRFAYLLVESLHPGSFTYTEALVNADQSGMMMYFSLATLTTLGFGDISPVSMQARALAGLEAFVGVFYTTVLVARLISAYRHSEPARPED